MRRRELRLLAQASSCSVRVSLSTPADQVAEAWRREELGVEEPGGVGAVVGPAVLRYHRFDLRESS